MDIGLRRRRAHLLLLLPVTLLLLVAGNAAAWQERAPKLRFRRESGTFKVVQVADMHYVGGRSTGCEDVLPSQEEGCSDLDTTAFLYRLLRAEDPDLVVFTGDNINGVNATGAAKSMDAAIAPAIDMKLPWAAVIGNHDQECSHAKLIHAAPR